MTATTSKLGADMLTDEQLIEIASRYAHSDGWLNGDGALNFARALLARQPAAIDKEAFAEYRRGVKETFHLANMINANRQGRTAEETCSYLVGSLATLANGGEAPVVPLDTGESKTGVQGERGSSCMCSGLGPCERPGDVSCRLARAASPAAPSVAQDERGANSSLPFESALSELINKIDSGLDSGDLLQDARRASAAIDVIMRHGDLVANAHDYFRDSGERYEKSIQFRIGWNACLDAIANARAASTSANVAQGAKAVRTNQERSER